MSPRHLSLLAGSVTAICLTLVSLTTAAPATAATAAGHSQHSQHSQHRVTWSGWEGVKLGTSLAVAHQRLGGDLFVTGSTQGGCGDVLTLPNGKMDGNLNRDPHAVGNISAAAPTRYPLGISMNTSRHAALQRVRQSHFRLHSRSYDNYGNGDITHDYWVVGRHGHTLYFSYLDSLGRFTRMGLAIDKHVARGQLVMNGC